MTRNVAIVTNFRTGSTSFTLQMSKKHSLPYKGELFSHEKPHAIGDLPNRNELMHAFQTKGFPLYMADIYLSRWNLFEELRKGAAACYKIMPTHFQGDLPQLETVLSQADRVYYLYRKDFMSQIKSWMEVRLTGSFDKTGFDTNVGLKPSADEKQSGVDDPYTKRMHQLHLGEYQVGETYRNTIDPNDPVFGNTKLDCAADRLVKQLVTNYEIMGDMYKRVPGDLVCYEDYFSGDSYKPYNREITWTSEPQIDQYVDNWDIESYFK